MGVVVIKFRCAEYRYRISAEASVELVDSFTVGV
jgi:hypothetical protein